VIEVISNSVSDTQNYGRNLAKSLQKGRIILLNGDVGCGKTEFVRGVLAELNPEISVSSPTFSIVNSYKTENFTVHHFDFYRIKNINELFEIGFEEYLSEDSVLFVEWADMFPQVFEKNSETINFSAISPNSRKIMFAAK
jgi:tRNA threonylcarbamoyladenosine biosynthesis protein TsaE